MPEATYCPLIQKKCVEAKCKFWTHLLGRNPQTGDPLDEFNCAVQWLPILLIENAQQMRQAGAATESFRNEVIKRQDAAMALGMERERMLK